MKNRLQRDAIYFRKGEKMDDKSRNPVPSVGRKTRRYGLFITGRKRAIYFKTRKERNKAIQEIKGTGVYSTFHEDIK